MILHPELQKTAEPAIPAANPPRPPCILVVDDEQMVLSVFRRVLTEGGYELVCAQSGFECVDLFRRGGPSYDLVLTDLSMPLMDGEETFQRLRQIAPAAKVVLMAGFVDNSRLEKMMSNGLSGFVGKPFAPVEILAVVTSLLSGADQSKADTTDIAAAS